MQNKIEYRISEMKFSYQKDMNEMVIHKNTQIANLRNELQ